MLGIGSALIGLTRALVPPQAAPEASIEVPRTATTNMDLRDELKLSLKASVQQRLQQVQQAAEATQQAAEAGEQAQDTQQTIRQQQQIETVEAPEQVDETRRVDRLHHVTRAEASIPAGLEYGEAGLIQAIYRDQALFSPSAYAALEAAKVVTVPLPWEQG